MTFFPRANTLKQNDYSLSILWEYIQPIRTRLDIMIMFSLDIQYQINSYRGLSKVMFDLL